MNKLLLLTVILATTACASRYQYTSAEYRRAQIQDLHIPKTPYVVRVEASVNLKEKDIGPFFLLKSAEKALNETRVATHSNHAENTLKISANWNPAPPNSFFDFTCSYLNKTQVLDSYRYEHAIISMPSNVTPPNGFTLQYNLITAFDSMTKDIVVNCLADLQKNGLLMPSSH